MLKRRAASLLLVLPVVFAFACSDAAQGEAAGADAEIAAPSSNGSSGGPNDPHAGHTMPDGGGSSGDPNIVRGPDCDEDNPLKAPGTRMVDRSLPDPIVQFQRSLSWGCKHREYHETRLWDFIAANATKYPEAAVRLQYAKDKGWVRATRQEGEAGSGMDFLSMHRAMLGTLRERFPENAKLFQGWSTVPQTSTAEDPVPVTGDAGAAPAFWDSMKTAITRLETNLASFTSEDELGIWIETQHRPTAQDPLARSTDKSSGLHTYIHVRFDDQESPFRMQRFSRNLESEVFYKLHAWLDGIWTKYRQMKGLVDATDTKYGEAMHHACMHMGLGHWSLAKSACLK